MAAVAKNWMLRILAWAAGVFAVLAIAVASLIWWVVVHPNDAWGVAQRFLPADLAVTWNEIHFAPKKNTWLHWDIIWQVKGLNITKGSPKIQAPIDELALTFSFSVFKPATRVDFAQIRLIAGQKIVFQPSNEPAQEEPEQSPFQILRSYLDYLSMANDYASTDQLDIQIKDFVLEPVAQGEPISVAILVAKPANAQNPESASFDITIQSKEFNGSLVGALTASRMDTVEPFLTAQLQFRGFKVEQEAELSAIFSNETLDATVNGKTRYRLANRVLRSDPKIKIRMDEQNAEIMVSTPFMDLPGPLVKLDKVDANLSVPLENGIMWSEKPARFNVSGPVELFFIDKDMRPPLEKSCSCKIPERLQVKSAGQVWFRTLLSEAPSKYKKPAFDVRVSIESVKNKLFSADIAGQLAGFREGASWIYGPKLDSEVHVYSYRGVRNFLDAKNILIPAPFDVLEGTIDLTAKGPVVSDEKGSQTPVSIKTALSSEHQKIKLDAEVRIALDKAFKSLEVFFKLNIEDLMIELPPLDPVAGIPKVARDSRVQIQPAKPRPPPKFKVSLFFEVKTMRPGAIRLLSKLAKPHVPITVNLQRSMGGELTGTFQIEPFDINYLRRTVHVEQLRVLMDSKESADFPVDGRFRVDQTQYRIFVDVGGTLRSPSIRLSSEPELPRPEIISVLLYDRTSDQLISGDAETAGSFEAAMADRAIGLFGLWALSSTPIRSFSYNPVTKVYAATVQLSDGVSAGIGTDWEEAAHLEVRKRVSKRWVLTASYSPSETDKENIGQVVLQWEKRF